MPVETTHKLYDASKADWQQCEDTVAGQRRIHQRGEIYLPRLSGMKATVDNDAAYKAYKMRAAFFNAAQRTVAGMLGLVFRNEPVYTLPGEMETFAKDVTASGESLGNFSAHLVEANIEKGRIGVLVDFPQADGEARTQADAEQRGMRPRWCRYPAETILNWWTGTVDNQTVLTRVTLREVRHDPDPNDEFKTNEIGIIRELGLDDSGSYYQQLWENSTGAWKKEGEAIYPQKDGASLNRIPFWFIAPTGGDPDPVKPPINDLVDVNLQHYRNSADYEHGLHYCGLPTPWATGVTNDEAPNGIGPNQMWTATSADAKFGLLEFSGQGLEPLEKAMDEKKARMAALGADMLRPNKLVAETEGAKALDKESSHSVLAGISISTSTAIEEMLRFTAEWSGVSGDIAYQLNRDFIPEGIDAQMLTSLLAALQGNAISYRTFFDNLKEGGLIGENVDEDNEREEIEQNPAPMGGDFSVNDPDANSE